MKKIVLLAMISFFSQVIIAQVDTATNYIDSQKKKADRQQHYIMMQAGQMVIVRNDKVSKLEKDITLKNGTLVTTTGTVKTTDGNTTQLREGDRIYFNGAIRVGTKNNVVD